MLFVPFLAEDSSVEHFARIYCCTPFVLLIPVDTGFNSVGQLQSSIVSLSVT